MLRILLFLAVAIQKLKFLNNSIINRREHNIGFDVVQLVFGDPRRIERIDQSEGNTFGEERWQTLGMAGKVLFVVYTEREKPPA
jgi:uncharacterized DUF497 family protein